MRDFTITSASLGAIEAGMSALRDSLAGRAFDLAPAIAISTWKTPPVEGLDDDGLPVIKKAGTGQKITFLAPLRLHDDGPVPRAPKGCTLTPRQEGEPGFAAPPATEAEEVS